jgi:single-stranded-DNA-specific exonuclease
MPKKWVLHPDRPDQARRLATALRVAEVTARLLVNRGLTGPAEAQSFLQPSLHELKDPCNHPPAVEAARFLLGAARAGRRIAIFGDYDADGICAAALLIRCFRYLDTEVELYIPDRVEEGYGLSCEALAELADRGTEVVITVDCGVSAAAEVAYARERGIEMVITDHHEPGERLPEARHLLDPKLPSCGGLGYEGLAGVGVAFKLVWAIGQELSDTHRVSDEFRDFLMEALSLVAVGTVADVVPLVDENRILTHYGLKTLPAVSRPGLRALMAVSRLDAGGVSAEDVAFRLAPRLNAAGRMGDARSAVELLTTTDERHAADLAEHLEQQNRLRKSVQQAVLQDAEERLAQQAELRERSCIVLADPDWHQGVVGLVASRLAERYWRPAFVFTANGHVACGSARSVPGFPLFTIVKECAGLLERFGGHQGAAGMTLRMENLPAFTEKVCGLAARFFGAERPSPTLELDGEVRLADLNAGLLSEISRLEPFGNGNPEPCFAACGLQLVGHPRLVGSSANHLAFMVRQDRCVLRAIAMRRTDWLEEFRARRGEPFALAFQPYVSTYGGKVSVELRAEDLRWESDGALAADSGQAS